MKTYRLKEDTVLYPKGTIAEWEDNVQMYCIHDTGIDQLERWQIEGNSLWEEVNGNLRRQQETIEKPTCKQCSGKGYYQYSTIGTPHMTYCNLCSGDVGEDEKEEPTRWRAEEGESYWYLDEFNVVESRIHTPHYFDMSMSRYGAGNMFPSRRQAEFYKIRLESLLYTAGASEVFEDVCEDGTYIFHVDFPEEYHEAWSINLYDPNLFQDE